MLQGPESNDVYEELQRIASIHLSRSARTPSLQATQLVHEAWLRLHDRGWKSKTHFLALASRAMRHVLIDTIRARLADKRGGGALQVTLAPGAEIITGGSMENMIAVDQVLTQLAEKDERKARVVELRFFAGCEFAEIAEALEVSEATVKRDWEFARTWMYARLKRGR
jgi:RNA polymerase sigma-70 factor, ECF subfamily